MQYRRMPIEIEAPEWIGYENIECNLSESAFADQRLSSLGITLDDLVLHYGDHMGKPELRELIASEAGLTPDDVLLTPGAAAALFIIATSLLERGDRLVVAKPNYATNIETPRAIGADIAYLHLKFDAHYRLDLAELEKLVTDQTKLVSLTYPHNPTGAMISTEELQQVIAIVERKGCYLLIDETYREMSFSEPPPIAAQLSENVISVSSMSKAYGLPGIRMGWILCRNKTLMEKFLAAKEQIVITNSVADEEIAYRYLSNKERLFAPARQMIRDHFSMVRSFMQQQDVLEWVQPGGGCICFPRVKDNVRISMDEFHEVLLNKYRTYVGRGHWFEEDKRHIRIGFGWEKSDKLQRGLSNIVSAIEAARTRQ